MPTTTPQQLVALQSNTEKIRNICILAHVDHGKTSLSDSLLASNGIISPKLAGKVRFLDSRPDEQIRGITMESSAISLHYRALKPPANPGEEPSTEDFLINLIDSPGHIDFSSEVSTASRLCDGAVVLVDAVEGVCSQTVTVLRQTWIERMRPVLVINKIDRLITELKLTPLEAFVHLSKLLEQVNAVMGSFFAGDRMEEDLKWREHIEQRQAKPAAERTPSSDGIDAESVFSKESEYEEKDDEDLYFSPEKFNVVFASAIDGWAFTVRDFAAIHEKKLGVKRELLEKVLWGDFYLDPKTKRVLRQKHLKGKNLKPMFVQFCLDNIWALYENVLKKDRDFDKVEKIVKALGLKILPRDLKSKDTRALLFTMFGQWLPLSRAVLGTVIRQLPSPSVAQNQRMGNLMATAPGGIENVSADVKTAVENLDVNSDTVVAYVSKMIAVPESSLPHNQRKQLTADEMREIGRLKRQEIARALAAAAENGDLDKPIDSVPTKAMEKTTLEDSGSNTPKTTEEEDKDKDKENLIGFARLYSGTIRVGQTLYALGPKYNPAHPDEHIHPVTVTDLYLMMGRDLVPLEQVPAGNVFGIRGLEGKVLKNGTLCSSPRGGVNLAGVSGMGAAPIVRVAVEPKNPTQLKQLIAGLKLLEQADPCVEYIVQENGEHVILTAGELHLERCLKDLRERFAKIEIQESKPIVPYRETIMAVTEMSPPKDPKLPRGVVQTSTSSKYVSFRIKTRPMPAATTVFLQENEATVKKLYSQRIQADDEAIEEEVDIDIIDEHEECMSLEAFKDKLQATMSKGVTKDERESFKGAVDRITTFGPKRTGPNILVDMTHDTCKRMLSSEEPDPTKIRARRASSISGGGEPRPRGASFTNAPITPRDIEDTIVQAFQLATFQGPMCNEPTQGVAVFLEEVKVEIPEEEMENVRMKLGQLVGEVITCVTAAIKQGFLDWSPRLLLAMYSCDIQASTEVLGKVYGVITRRRGRIVAEEMKEGTPFFTIKSLLPVAESFGFADEIRTKTSGAASPQLIFSGFENVIDEDPFWMPFTEDELEDLGEIADRENVAKKYMDAVRKRKGLFVGTKLRAEKQKTLKR